MKANSLAAANLDNWCDRAHANDFSDKVPTFSMYNSQHTPPSNHLQNLIGQKTTYPSYQCSTLLV
uniref:Uncharacterized protein n=1 Tax=Romanomermis culicivorax TaxID=13658 RepID=A0A915KMK2_ROMCU